MLYVTLEFGDFAIIAILICALTGVGIASSSGVRPPDRKRLEQVEQKLDLILTHLGIEDVPLPRTSWQVLADDPGQKIAAVKEYREQHAVGLAKAMNAVEDYIEGRNGS